MPQPSLIGREEARGVINSDTRNTNTRPIHSKPIRDQYKLTSRGVDEQASEQQLHIVVAEVEGHHLGDDVSMLALH